MVWSLLRPSFTASKNGVKLFSTSPRHCPRWNQSPVKLDEAVGSLNASTLVKPFFFTVAFSCGSFAGAAIWQYESHKSRAKVIHGSFWYEKPKREPSWLHDVKNLWHRLPDGEKIFIPICALNLLVFGAWRIPALTPAMMRLFVCNPAMKNNCWPMVLSTFSHYSPFHIFANMYVLHSFSSVVASSMGKEQFLGFYMTGGVLSSFASYAFKVFSNKPSMSLGASGAIMSVLGYTCAKYPELKLSVILLPFFTFEAGDALKVIMAIDATGMILGWKVFDHAAHLGGAVFGLFWAHWGSSHLWQNRGVLLRQWKKIRE